MFTIDEGREVGGSFGNRVIFHLEFVSSLNKEMFLFVLNPKRRSKPQPSFNPIVLFLEYNHYSLSVTRNITINKTYKCPDI